MKSKARKVLRKLQEAKEIQRSIDNDRTLPKKFKIDNELVMIEYSFQTRLKELSEEDALKLLESKAVTGREGFFCIKSSKNLTLEEALQTYRKKVLIEKTFSMGKKWELSNLGCNNCNAQFASIFLCMCKI